MSSHDQSHRPNLKGLPPIKGLRDRGWVSLRTFASSVADISYPTALRWCKLKMLNYQQVGGTKRVYEEEIARFIQHGTLPPDQELRQAEKDKREEYKQNGLKNRT